MNEVNKLRNTSSEQSTSLKYWKDPESYPTMHTAWKICSDIANSKACRHKDTRAQKHMLQSNLAQKHRSAEPKKHEDVQACRNKGTITESHRHRGAWTHDQTGT